MKTVREKVVLGMFCICFVFACSKTEEVEWVKSNNVTVAWDATTTFEDGTPITPDIELQYNVYIDRDTDNTHEDKELLTREPITDASFTIDTIEHKGKYYIGAQTLAYRIKDGKRDGDPIKSRISWSSNKSDTESGSFGIRTQ